MRYNFILFENFYWATNHYKDLVIIAELLKNGGYSVAIADIFQEAKLCQVSGIPHIQIHSKKNVIIEPSKSRYHIVRNVVNIIRKVKIDSYLKNAIKEIGPLADSFYVGSYHSGMSLHWIKEFPVNVNIIFWGLRSYRIKEYRVRPFSKVAVNSWRLSRFVFSQERVKFFVSDELIKLDFLQVGIPENRLIIRPERYCISTGIPNIQKGNSLRLLSIGSLRPEKRIEKIIDAINNVSDNDVYYTIAGRVSKDYMKCLLAHIHDNNNIETLFQFLSEELFLSLIQKTDFLVLCDIRQPSLVTNGTMNEALLNGVPIIAPNYLPYSFYVEKYGVGLLYNPDEKGSLEDTIKKAKKSDRLELIKNINEYRKMLTFDKVKEGFNREIEKKIMKR